MDITLLLSSVTALAAIISPAVTAHINNRAAYRQQAAQMFFNAKTETYKKFLAVASSLSYPLKIRDVHSSTLIFSSEDVQAAISVYMNALTSCSENCTDAELNKIADARFNVAFAMQHDLESFK